MLVTLADTEIKETMHGIDTNILSNPDAVGSVTLPVDIIRKISVPFPPSRTRISTLLAPQTQSLYHYLRRH